VLTPILGHCGLHQRMDDNEPRVYTAFENADLFFTRLDAFLAVDVQREPENVEQETAEYHLRMKLEVMVCLRNSLRQAIIIWLTDSTAAGVSGAAISAGSTSRADGRATRERAAQTHLGRSEQECQMVSLARQQSVQLDLCVLPRARAQVHR